MNGLRLVGLALSLVVLTSITIDAGSAQSLGKATGKAAKPPPAVGPSGALQGPVNLGPAIAKQAAGLQLPPDWEAEESAHNALRQRSMMWRGDYDRYMGRVANCLNKDHTVSDQTAAGCVESDTLAVCMDKIYNACLNHPSRKPLEGGVSALVTRAEALSAEAAELATRIPDALPKFRELPTSRPALAPAR